MTEYFNKILEKIQNHKLHQLEVGDDLIMPYYDGLSLVNIPGTISHLLSAPRFGQGPLDPILLDELGGSYEKVVLLLVDAMGQQLFKDQLLPERNTVWGRHLDKAVYAPITSICPSTTASALTSLWTGVGPSVHGIIGYEMWAKEYGMLINNINHSAASSRGDTGGLSRSGFDPHLFMPAPRLGTHLISNGIRASAYMHSSITNSGLSLMQLDDVNLERYYDEADLWVSLAEFMNGRPNTREYIYVYYSHVDSLMHRFSAQNKRVELQFDAFSSIFEEAFLNMLEAEIARKTLFILLADHGSMTTPQRERYELRKHPELLDKLVMQPTCENRLAFFYIKPGKVQAVRDYIERYWGDEFYLVDSDVALESGLFGKGPFHPSAHERVGDLIAIARGDAYFWWALKTNHMMGRHGGLHASEMLVPFYALPLGEI